MGSLKEGAVKPPGAGADVCREQESSVCFCRLSQKACQCLAHFGPRHARTWPMAEDLESAALASELQALVAIVLESY